MFIVQVQISVKPDHVEAFKAATLANASASVTEPGCARFDVGQLVDDPTRFTLFEVYHAPEGFDAHKQTPHFAIWRDTVADMMAEPRTALKFASLFPGDDGW